MQDLNIIAAKTLNQCNNQTLSCNSLLKTSSTSSRGFISILMEYVGQDIRNMSLKYMHTLALLIVYNAKVALDTTEYTFPTSVRHNHLFSETCITSIMVQVIFLVLWVW